MPRRVCFIFVSLLFLGACGGGSNPTSSKLPPATVTGPQMSVTPTALQATVTMGNTGPLAFTVRNNGDSALTFQATTSETWIAGLASLGNVNVNAGAASTVNLQAQCSATGQLSGTISVTGNAADNPTDTIDITVDCAAPALQVQIIDAPAASNGSPGVDATSSLSWGIASSWPLQPDVTYTVTANDPGVVISNDSGSIALAGQIQNNLSYACPAPGSRDATVTIDAGGSQASVHWQIECVPVLEGNVTFDGAEFYQGPLAAQIDGALAVTGFVDMVAGREALLAMQLGHDSATVPEFTVDATQTGQSTTLTAVLLSVQNPTQTGTGRWASLYVLNIPAGFVQVGNDLVAVMDPNNQIAETSETDNGFTVDMATLGLVEMPLFKPVFVPINAEGRTPATIVAADYLVATTDLFPVADHVDSVHAVYDYQGGTWNWQTALNEMSALWNAEGDADEFYHGVYRQPNNFNGGTTGIGFVGFPVAVSSSLDSPLGDDETVAHEFGHNFGLDHAPGGCGEGNVDPNYPYAFGAIGPNGGWLFSEARYIAPESGYFDVMTYCRPQYISDYHYQKVIDTFATGQAMVTQSVVGVAAGSIALSGSIDEYGTWTLTHVIDTAKPARAAQSGPFLMILYGDDGMELYRQSLDCHHTGHGDFAVWAVRVPMPSVPVGAVRIWDAVGNLLLDEDLPL